MTIAPCGTFQYVVTIPDCVRESSGAWPVSLAETIERTGDSLSDSRLLGHSPTLTISDGGAANPPEKKYKDVFRSRFTLRASQRKHATASEASFYMDRTLADFFRSGDLLHVSRTSCGGVGLSLIRDKELVFALGAITAVPLGSGVQVFYPADLIREAEKIFRHQDKDFRFFQSPLHFKHGSESRILFSGFGWLGEYEFAVKHGYILGTPGTDECAAIWLKSAKVSDAVRSSAEILSSTELEIRDW